jgi:hypothetical protein
VVLEKEEEDRWIERARNGEVHRVKQERNILHTVKRGKANWIGYILCMNCLLKQVIEQKIRGRIEVTGRRGRRSKQLLMTLRKERIEEAERERSTKLYVMENWFLEEAVDLTKDRLRGNDTVPLMV